MTTKISTNNIAPNTVLNGVTLASAANGFTIAGGTASKTLTLTNTMTISGTDGATLNIGSGGTLGTAAYATIANYQLLSGKNAASGYAGLSATYQINFKNAANTFTSFMANANSAARTYTFQNRNGTIADNTDLALKANIASPVFTGNVTGLGVATGTSFNAITGLASVNPLMDGTVALGTSTLAARQDHRHASDTSRAAVAQTMYIGTTALAINRGSAGLTLTGTSIDGSAGSAATATTATNLSGGTVNATTVAASSSILSSSPSAGIGYTTGAGGAVTQITNIVTAVTLNKVSGKITTVSFSLASLASNSFVLNNSVIAAGDVVVLTTIASGSMAQLVVTPTSLYAGHVTISLFNPTAISLGAGTLTINFAIIKGSTT